MNPMTEELKIVSLCPGDEMADVVRIMQESDSASLQVLSRALDTWPDDSRLRLLRGATYAGQHDYANAKADFSAVLDLAPDYTVARFMLGFLELTSGQIKLALHAWEPLDALPADDTLRMFKSGLVDLIHDRFSDALLQLRQGMASNRRYPLINNYVAAVIDKIGIPPTENEKSVDLARGEPIGDRFSPSSNSQE